VTIEEDLKSSHGSVFFVFVPFPVGGLAALFLRLEAIVQVEWREGRLVDGSPDRSDLPSEGDFE
jgi:hypothetical protein